MDTKLLWITSFLLLLGIFAKSQKMAAKLLHEDGQYELNILDWHSAIPGSFRNPVVTDERNFFYPTNLQTLNFSVRNSFEKTINGISGLDIIQKYITAIGGPQQFDSINTLTYIGDIKINKIELGFREIKSTPNLDDIALYIDHDTVMRSFFDGKTGFNQRVAQKIELSNTEVQERNLDYLGLFNQLYYLNPKNDFYMSNISLDTANQEKCFRLDIRMPSGKLVSEFYSKQTYFLVKSNELDIENGAKKLTTKFFSNYKPFDNILFPTNIIVLTQTDENQQNIQLSFESININD